MNSPLSCSILLAALIATGQAHLDAAAPLALDDILMVAAGSSITADFRLNDSDSDGDLLSITGTSTPANGMVTDNGNGTFSYAPNPGFTGLDTFTYNLTDGTSIRHNHQQ